MPETIRHDQRAPRARVRALALAAVLGAPLPAVAQGGGAFEPPPRIEPGDLLPAALVRSGTHRVLNDVVPRGNMAEFVVESDYGSYRVVSAALTIVRVQEISTLAQAIDQYNRTNEPIGEELRGQLRVGANSFVEILASPIQTTGSLVGQFGKNVGQTFEELGKPVGEDATGAPRRGGFYTRFEPGDPVLASHKRNAASQLDLDVYSTNPQVQSFLDTLAKARASGNASAGVVSVSLPRATEIRVANGRIENQVRAALTRATLNEIYRRNAARLVAAGIDEALVDRFLSHPLLSPRHTTAITEYAAFMNGVGNRGALLEAALSVRSESDALARVQSARMLAIYHERERPLRLLHSGGHVTLGVSEENDLVVSLPFDFLYWDEQAERTFGGLADYASTKGYASRSILTSGLISGAARIELARLGFGLREHFLQPR